MSSDTATPEPGDDPIGYFLDDVTYHGKSERTRAFYERVLRGFEAFLSDETLPGLREGTSADAYERKVLGTFIEEGRIRAFPSQRKKQRVLHRWAVQRFEPGRRYAERDVNDILAELHEDTARLRRAFVEEGLMEREGGGGAYWRPLDEAAPDDG